MILKLKREISKLKSDHESELKALKQEIERKNTMNKKLRMDLSNLKTRLNSHKKVFSPQSLSQPSFQAEKKDLVKFEKKSAKSAKPAVKARVSYNDQKADSKYDSSFESIEEEDKTEQRKVTKKTISPSRYVFE